MIGCEVTTVVSDVDESKISAQTPEMLALALSKAKADAVYNILKDDSIPIVAADTLVCVENEILGKPKDRNDAKRMLKLLSDKAHQVHTGYTVLFNGRSISCCDTSDVIFRQILDSELEEYLDSNEPYDKAGGYGIQDRASVFVEKIDGDFYNVVGLPVYKMFELMKKEFDLDFFDLIN